MGLQRPELVPTSPELGMVSGRIAFIGAPELRRPIMGITARGIVAAFDQAEAGFPSWQCDLFDKSVESDGHLRSQLKRRRDGVALKPWLLQAGGDATIDRKAAELLERALRRFSINFPDTLSYQCKAIPMGWSASEIDWDLSENMILPTWFANIPHRRFIVKRGELRLGVDGVENGVELEPGKWWITCAEPDEDPVRGGFMRTCAWYSLFKRMSVRDWVVFAERFGLPYVTGEYDATASKEDKSTLEAAIQRLGTDGQAMFSTACKIVVHTLNNGGKAEDVHGAIAAFCNAEMSKLVTGATLTAETGGPGSFALGEVHADQAFDLRAGDAEMLARSFERHVALPFCIYNGLQKARLPRLVIQVVRDLAPKIRAQIAALLAEKLGLTFDEEQMRQEFNFKAPRNGAGLRFPGAGEPGNDAPGGGAPAKRATGGTEPSPADA